MQLTEPGIAVAVATWRAPRLDQQRKLEALGDWDAVGVTSLSAGIKEQLELEAAKAVAALTGETRDDTQRSDTMAQLTGVWQGLQVSRLGRAGPSSWDVLCFTMCAGHDCKLAQSMLLLCPAVALFT